jgi:hypothetical protein
MTKGLPRAPDQSRPVTATQTMLFGMVEAMTMRLRRGDPVSDETCRTIEGFVQRAQALDAAYQQRLALVEGDDDEA